MINLKNVRLDCRDDDGTVNREKNLAFQLLVKDLGVSCSWVYHGEKWTGKPFLMIGGESCLFYRDEYDSNNADVFQFKNIYMTLVNGGWELSDTKPIKPRTKIDYVKVHQSEAVKAVMEGNKDYYFKGGDDSHILLTMQSELEKFCRALRKTETEIKTEKRWLVYSAGGVFLGDSRIFPDEAKEHQILEITVEV